MFDVNKYSVFNRVNNIGSGSGSSYSPTSSSAYKSAIEQSRNKQIKYKEETKRSSLDRFIDAISVGNYLGAGIVKGIVDDDSTVLGNIGKAIDASNPFGDGNETGEFSYTDTLDEFWNPTSTIGKIAKGAVGFAGDVFLDPTTYLTLGIGTALKGSKGALKLAGIADKVIDADKAFDTVKRFSDVNNLGLTDDVLKQQADVLLQKHNKLIGINNNAQSVTASLANAPFGEKIFGNLSKNSKVLATEDMVRGFGDKTVAPIYQKIRSDVMKSKFADLFSNNAKLYKKALDNPDELYKYMRSEAMQKAQAGKLIKFKDKVLTQGQNINKLDLTPDEQKQIRNMLEDPSTFNLVFSTSIKEDKATVEALKQKFGYLQDDFSKNMEDYLSELRSYDELMDVSKIDEDRILSQIADSEDELKMLTENYEAEKTAIIDSIKAKRDEMITDLASIPAPVLSQAGKLEEVNEILLRESERLTEGKFEPINAIDKIKPEFISEIDLEINGTTSSNATKLKKQIQDKGYVLYKDKVRAYAFKKNNPKWVLKETSDGVMLTAPKVVKIGDEVFKEINDNNVGEFVKLLNENYDMKISPLTDKSQIKVFYDMINSGKSKKAIMDEYSLRKMRLTGYDARLYSKVIAPTLGYKNFAKEIEKPLAELEHIKQSKGALTDSEQKKFNRLLRISAQRDKMVKEYYSRFPDVDSLNKHIEYVSNARAKQAMADKNFDVASTREEILEDRMVEERLKFFDDERRRGRQGDTVSDELYRYEPVLDKDEIEFISVDIKDTLFPNAKVGTGLSAHMKKIADKVPTVIENNYKYRVKMSGYDDVKVPYMYDLSEEARAKIYKQAKYLVDNEVKSVDALKDVVKQIRKDVIVEDTVKVIDDIKEMTEKIDAVIPNPSEYSKSFSEVADEVDELSTKLYEKATDDVDFMKQVDEVKANINNLNKQLVDIKQSRVQLKQLLDSKDNVDVDKYLKEFDGLSNEIKTREETLNRHIRFLDSANINPENFDNIDKLYKIDIMDVDDKIKETVKMLRESFYKMGADELAIGKLKSKQFDKWAYSYLPHILTEEGREFIEKNADTIGKSIPGFDAKKIGYGRTFNPFSKERSLNNIVLNGKPIENPNIDELNEFFQSNFPELKGNKVFIDNISDLYIKRALKHADVMYDHKYMNDMLGTFGTRYNGGFVDGEKIVMNYGVLRERVMTEARKQFKQSWDEYDLQNDISKNIMADYPKGTKEFNQLMKRERLNYMQKLTEDVLRVGYNLPPQSLHDLSTPMIELTKEQADNLYSKFGEASEIYTVNDLIVDKANQSRKYQIKKDNNQLLDMYDKFTHFIKLNQTTVMPSFHVRNKISNTFNNWLAIGSDAVNTKFQKTAYKAIKSDGKIDDILIVTKKDGSKVEMPWSDVYQKARQYDVLNEGFFEKDLGTTSALEANIGKLKPELNPLNTKKFKPYVVGSKIGTKVENSDRLIHFASQLSRGMDYVEASESVNKYLFDYSDLTDFERNVMKRVFPYYTWLRKNAPLQLESMLEQPEKFRDVNKVMTGISNMNSPEDRMEERYTANFAQDWLQTPFTGKTGNPIIFNPNLPMQDVNRIPDVTDLGESARQLISQMNPLLKVPLEQATNKNFYMDSPITSEGGNETVDRLMHVLSQLSGVNTAKNIVTNEGTDRAMQVLNALTGLKFSDYNYEGYKNMIKGGGEE